MSSICSLFLSLLSVATLVTAAPTSVASQLEANKTCTNPVQRKAWHNLSNAEKKDYIDATLCLMSKPATEGFPGASTRWDELTYIHRVNTNIVHDVGALLPWHRYYTYLHEQMLRNECGYSGYQPYWETVLDVGDILGSVILDPVTGFGGNGTGDDLCITDGPFADVTLHIGPKYTDTDHCVSRNINELVAQQNCSQANIDELFTYTTFESVYDLFDSSIHTGGHSAIGGSGGVMTDLINSPGDPIFFLHHANIDRIWWKWQSVDPTNRLYDIAGRNLPTDEYISSRSLEAATASEYDYFGDGGNVTTLNHNMWLVDVMPNRTIATVMDIKRDASFLCYEYV